MNILEGVISHVRVNNNLSLVSIDVNNIPMTAIIIDTPDTAPYLQVDNKIKLIFKETEVIIGSGSNIHISLQNRLEGVVKIIESGELLSRLTIDTKVGQIVSVITSNAVKQLNLLEGSEVVAMIKTNEIMLSE